MIYVTGDTHGGSDAKKLVNRNVSDRLTKDDTLIICGDFGFIWDRKKESRKEKGWLDWFADRPWTTLFVDGNHECFPRLNSYPETEMFGGKVHQIRKNLFHLERGQVFTVEGKKIFAFGGASSHNTGPHDEGKYWWPEELPSEEEYARAEQSLKECGYKVDYVITHCMPTPLQEALTNGAYPRDALTDWFQELRSRLKYEHWYTGHYHVDNDFEDNITVLFSKVIPIGESVINTEPAAGNPVYHKDDCVRVIHEGEEKSGLIISILPWGTISQKKEPVYNIRLDEKFSSREVQVQESAIRGLIYVGKIFRSH